MQQALQAMVDKTFLKSTKQQELQWRALTERVTRDGQGQKRIEGAHHDLLGFLYLFIKACGSHGIPMHTHNLLRDAKHQQQLLDAGNSLIAESSHMYGMGADCVHSKLYWNLTKDQWAILGHIGKEVAANNGLGKIIEWGGDWKRFPDPAHWQIRNWRQYKDQYPWVHWTRKTWRVGKPISISTHS